jgi:Short C-terminal domain
MLRRRRPLLRAAMVGGAGYAAGRNVAERRQQQKTQEEEVDALGRNHSVRAIPAPPGRPSGSSVIERAEALVKLKGLLDSGALSQEEFDIQKRRMLQEG